MSGDTEATTGPFQPDGSIPPNDFWAFVPELGVYISKVDGQPLDPRWVRKEDGSPSASQGIEYKKALTFTTAFMPSYDPSNRPLDVDTAFQQDWQRTHPDFPLIEV